MTTQTSTGKDNVYHDVALPLPKTRAKLIFFGILIAMFAQQVMTYGLTPAAPFLVEELNGWQWYALLFSLATMIQALLTPAANTIGRILTMKRTLIGGVILFVIQFVMTMVAQDVLFVVLARCIGGVGAAGVFTCGLQMIVEIFPPTERPIYNGYYSSMTALCGVIGPILAGWICDMWTWRYTPILSLVASAVAIIMITIFMPKGRWQAAPEKVDVKGLLLMSIGVIAIVGLFSFGGVSFPWASWITPALLVVGLLFLAFFFKYESKIGDLALIPSKLWGNKIFLACFLLGFCGDGAFYIGRIYLPAYAQTVMGMNGTFSGLLVSVPSALSVIVGIALGALLAKTGRIKLSIIVITFVQAACILFIITGTPDTPYPLYLGVMTVLFGVTNGALPVLPFALCQSRMKPELAIQTTAVVMMGITIGCTVIVAIAGIVQNAIPDMFTGYVVLCVGAAVLTFAPIPVVLMLKPDKWYMDKEKREELQAAEEGSNEKIREEEATYNASVDAEVAALSEKGDR